MVEGLPDLPNIVTYGLKVHKVIGTVHFLALPLIDTYSETSAEISHEKASYRQGMLWIAKQESLKDNCDLVDLHYKLWYKETLLHSS